MPSAMMTTPPTGVLLLQLGTPDSPSTKDVRRYLREFLSDPRVIDLSALMRALLLNAVILPFRPRKASHAYQLIWTEEGSPLLIHTAHLTEAVRDHLGQRYVVEFAMRYKRPSIESAVARLMSSGCKRLVVMPLFPQYASASSGSAVAKTLDVVGAGWNVLDVSTISAFYDDPGYVRAVAAVTRPALDTFDPDHILFSYHGLPEKHIRKSDLSGEWCLQSSACCETISEANRFCYRAQSYATTEGIVKELGLKPGMHSTSFQSRLAGQKWIEPYTDFVMPDLYDRGVRRLAVLTPSFTADCLETLEEIGIRGRAQWLGLGGTDFALISCVNASTAWAEAVASLVRLHSPQ